MLARSAVASPAQSALPTVRLCADPAGGYVGRFQAMGGPCEVLIDCDDAGQANEAVRLAADEAWRIEAKFSRYRRDSVVGEINARAGAPVAVDDETASLLAFADRCFELSDGLFDITSGVLRKAWTFDAGARIPAAADIARLLRYVGWGKVSWDSTTVCLPPGMEIDLGGLGKEYAVDRAAALIAGHTSRGALVNFGGDLAITGPRRGDKAWVVGVDDPRRTGASCVRTIALRRGALATSGDARRFVLRGGVRYGHILDPRTGWPVSGAPRSVTVLADKCTEAGMLSTFAMLQGSAAEAFLREQGATHFVMS